MKKRRQIEERKTDFTAKEMPHTRRQIFLDLLKNQKRQMVSLSMLLFVFLLPLVVDILLFNMYIIGIDVGQEGYASTVFSLIFYMMIIAIPCVMIGFVGLGGLAHVCKNIAWQNAVLFGPEFFAGIKKNWKQSLVFGFIWGISLFLLVVGCLFMVRTQAGSDQPWVQSVGIGLCITQFVILSIICVYALTYSCYYQNTIWQVFRNSFVFFVAKFFKNLALFVLTTGLVVGLMFVDFIAQIVIIIVIAFLSSFMMIAWTLLSHEAFDQYINKQNYPDYYKKGLYISEEDKEK